MAAGINSADFSASGMVILDLKSKQRQKYRARALLDSGAGTNFVAGDVLRHLDFEILNSSNISVSGINTTQTGKYDLVLLKMDNEECPTKYIKCYTLPGMLRYNVSTDLYEAMMHDCAELPGFTDPLKKFADHGGGLGLILGPGAIRDISIDSPIYFKSYLVDRTYFGPAVSGRMPSNSVFAFSSSLFPIGDVVVANNFQMIEESNLDAKINLLKDLEFLSNKELIGVTQDEIHLDDKKCMDQFYKNLHYDEILKLYTVPLPWRPNKEYLPSNYSIAFRRMQQLQRKFMANPNYGKAYESKINELLTMNFIEEVVPGVELGDITHYLAHSGVVKEESDTTSLRIVMDGSSKLKGSLSLNDCLYTGPNIIGSLLECLLGFRCDKFALTADIEKAFLNLALRERDRDALRFLFPKDLLDPNSPLLVYRYKVVVFGASCSPYLLAAVIQKHIQSFVKDEKFKFSLRNLFVDNLLATNNSEEELLEFYYKARELFSNAGFNLRKWTSNSRLVNAAARREGIFDDAQRVKILGLYWSPHTDKISYKKDINKDIKYTKRGALRFSNSVFDPFGLISPIEIRTRLLVQSLWKEKLDWDKSFKKTEFKEDWDIIVNEVKIALEAEIPRQVLIEEDSQLHIFSDASKKAFGSVAYIVTPKSKNCPKGNSQIIFAKSKITKRLPPVETIPKLELDALNLSATIINAIKKSFPHIQFSRKVLWSDSMVALAQCTAPKHQMAYIHNRVNSIRTLAEGFEIRHISGKENPADYMTKPIKATLFLNKSLWWEGPEGLTISKSWDVENPYTLTNPINQTSVFIAHNDATVTLNTCYGSIKTKVKNFDISNLWATSSYRKCILLFVGLKRWIKFHRNKDVIFDCHF